MDNYQQGYQANGQYNQYGGNDDTTVMAVTPSYDQYGQQYDQQYGQQNNQQYGQQYNQQYGQRYDQQYGQQYGQQYDSYGNLQSYDNGSGSVQQYAGGTDSSQSYAGGYSQGGNVQVNYYQNSYPPVRQLPTNRGLVKLFFFSLLTLGIYDLIFCCRFGEDTNIIASRYDGKKTMHFLLMTLLTVLTCGIAGLVWWHRLSSRIGNELKRRGIYYSFGAGSFWLWNTLGLLIIIGPIVYFGKLCRALNLLSENYNIRG